jgi:hypothetical protein
MERAAPPRRAEEIWDLQRVRWVTVRDHDMARRFLETLAARESL